MNKIKLVILANNKNENFQINNIIKNLEFKKIDITILYSNNNYLLKKSFFYKILFKIIFTIEKKFINFSTLLLSKRNIYIKKKNVTFDKYINDQLINDKRYITDVIIDLGNHKINKNFIAKAKYGIWYLDNHVKDNFLIGFFDCLSNQKISTSYLISKKFFNNKLIIKCIDVSYLNTKINFWLRNKQFIIEKSANLISKNLNKIHYDLTIKEVNRNNFKTFSKINLSNFINYFFIKYFIYAIKKLFRKINEQNQDVWRIYLLNSSVGNFLSNEKIQKNSHMINPNFKHEYADPFIYEYNNLEYVFFENNDLNQNKGKISCGIIKDNKLSSIKDVLNLKYHLSYPFIWKLKKNFFLMPESSANKSLQIWKSVSFPFKWRLYKTIFKNEFCCDTSIISKSNNNWLLTNKSNDHTNDASNELYIYKIVGNFKKLIPHKLNPVITDCRTARNAGNLKFSNQLLRPSQINNSSGYGIGLNINKIIALNLETYKETTIKKIYPNQKNKETGIHHISNTKTKIVFDIRKKVKS